MNWISVNDELPELKHRMGVGNKYSDEVLVTNGEVCYLATLESVRPKFEKQFWVDTDDENLSGITHWMPLPTVEGLKN
jgi:hypothetical protein